MTAQTPQLRRRIPTTLHHVNMLYISIHPPDTTIRGFCLTLRFVFCLYTKWLTVEIIKLPCLDYVINDKKRGEVKSVLLHPRYDRELIYVAGVPFSPFHGGPDGLQVCFQYRDGKLIPRTTRITRSIEKKRNQPCMKVFGIEK